MRCGAIKNRLDAYLDGELDERSRAEVDAHIGGCADCRRTLEKLRKVAAGIVVSMPDSPTPEGFQERIMAAARRIEHVPQAEISAEFQPIRGRRMPFAMRAAAAAMIVLGLAIGMLMGRDVASRRVEPQPEQDAIASYGLDYFTEAPEGSLAGTYISLASGINGGRNGND